ncbi:hypothetical protein SCBWM1_gp168 [Synechococcus phage S-CBWM1]|uniref:Uncharacterized protein n=1 Tax=Synechococcus phage S-CBWM1 TaxID=2053653 RepID=A0A3G1L3U2_9CAUD|nr:hypothetical protein HOU61_gp029 [Synechococcus phage S-CBWM1]ATW62852.1 hypothetical protein SCBWM1_gp168 [Synechococcus phage S-CBWM1]
MQQKRGLKYPLTIADGGLQTSEGSEAKGEEIRSVIETRFFERVMRADYGVSDHTLEILNPHLVNSEFTTSISRNVRGLSSLSVQGDWRSQGEDGVYSMYVIYGTGNQSQSLQFNLAR